MSYYLEVAMLLAERGSDGHVLGERVPPGHAVRDPLDQEAANEPNLGEAA